MTQHEVTVATKRILADTIRLFNATGRLALPHVFFLLANGRQRLAMPDPDLVGSGDEGRALVATALRCVARDAPTAAVIQVAEVWMSPLLPAGSPLPTVRPFDHPQRQEGLVAFAETADGVVAYQAKIVRPPPPRHAYAEPFEEFRGAKVEMGFGRILEHVS